MWLSKNTNIVGILVELGGCRIILANVLIVLNSFPAGNNVIYTRGHPGIFVLHTYCSIKHRILVLSGPHITFHCMCYLSLSYYILLYVTLN